MFWRIDVIGRRWGKGGKHVLSQPWWQLHIFKKPMSTAGSGAVKPDGRTASGDGQNSRCGWRQRAVDFL
jgi:hypothetical protein